MDDVQNAKRVADVAIGRSEGLPRATWKKDGDWCEIRIHGPWFPKRDDVQGVARLRAHLLNEMPTLRQFRAARRIIVTIVVTSPDLDLDRAVAGCCTALDSQHGSIEAPLWDDNKIDEIHVSRHGGRRQKHA